MSIDRRTRRHSDTRVLPPASVRHDVLPGLLEEHGELAARGMASIGARPLTIVAADECFTVDRTSGHLSIRDGHNDAALEVAMEEEALSDAMQDVASLAWAAMMGRLTVERGTFDDLARWDPVLRTLRDGEPVFEPGTLAFSGLDGSPLDLRRAFRLDDEMAAAGSFLGQAGYVHLVEIFTSEEMDAVSAELDAAVATAERDDGQSWWARTADGWYPARILGFNRSSATLRELLRSEKFLRLTALVEDDLVQADVEQSDMAEGLLKKIGVLEGISDVSWHKDCGPGGHTLGCSGLTVGIQLTAADRETGELGVMAGSNRANIPGLAPVQDFGLERVPLPTAKGDVTIHCSCTMHMSRPPVSAERRVVYTSLALAPLPEDEYVRPSEDAKRSERSALQDRVGQGVGSAREQQTLGLD